MVGQHGDLEIQTRIKPTRSKAKESMNVILPFYNGKREVDHDVGPGWYGILERLNARLLETDPDYLLYQVKEKFGGLRFYTDALSKDGHEAVMVAEIESFVTCEQCGEPGTPTASGWIKTLCDPHKEYRG